jgi:putative DNA-invertase from lambdoid prophage Rac
MKDFDELLRQPGLHWLDKNLHLFNRSEGDHRFVFRFFQNGKRCDMPLGTFPHMTYTQAQTAAAQYRDMVARGVDPFPHHAQAQQARRNAHRTAADRLPAVYGYTRVSTTMQAEEGVSLAEQQRMILGRAMERGWTVTETFVEKGISGATPFARRPEGSRLNQALLPGDIVIAAKLDRMFRSAVDALNVIQDFQRRGVSLWLLDLGGDVSNEGVAKLVMTMLAAFAEFERERIGERIRDAKRHQRAAGKYLGGQVPFGWRHGEQKGEIFEDGAQQAALATMRRLRTEGYSLRAIAKAIGDQYGFKLGASTVHRLLKGKEP